MEEKGPYIIFYIVAAVFVANSLIGMRQPIGKTIENDPGLGRDLWCRFHPLLVQRRIFRLRTEAEGRSDGKLNPGRRRGPNSDQR